MEKTMNKKAASALQLSLNAHVARQPGVRSMEGGAGRAGGGAMP